MTLQSDIDKSDIIFLSPLEKMLYYEQLFKTKINLKYRNNCCIKYFTFFKRIIKWISPTLTDLKDSKIMK